MYPHLFRIGDFAFTAFPPMLFLGLAAGAWAFAAQLRKRGEPPELAWDALLWVAVAGILGAKLHSLALDPHALLDDPARALAAPDALGWYGGLLAGTLALVWQVRRQGLALAVAADAAAPAVALGYAVGRVGSLLVGRGYGPPTDGWVGVAFPGGSPPSTAGHFRAIGTRIPAEIPDAAVLAVHPTPLYEAAFMLLVFAVLWRLSGRLRVGRLSALFLGLHGAERLVMELLRPAAGAGGAGLDGVQWVSLGLVSSGLLIWGVTRLRTRPQGRPAPASAPAGFLAAALLGGPSALAAQEPADTAAGPAVPPAAAATTPLPPERPPPRLALSLAVGTLGLSALQAQPVVAERLDAAGEVTQTWPLSRSLAVEGGWQVQGSGLLALGPRWGLRAGVGIGGATVRPEYGDGPEAVVEEARELVGAAEGALDVLSAEVALRFRIPSSRGFQPYVELGPALERWTLDANGDGTPGLPVGAKAFTRFGGHVAAGGSFPLAGSLDGRVQVAYRLFRTPLEPAAPGAGLATGDTLRLSLEAVAAGPFSDAAVELTRETRLELGLSLRLGEVQLPKPEPEPAAEPSGSRR